MDVELKRSVELFLIRESGGERQILMSQRGPQKHGAGTFAVPGGHMERLGSNDRWETLSEAARREARLELGDALADVVDDAFRRRQVRVMSVVDDLRQKVQYVHTAFAIQVPDNIDPNPNAAEGWEHSNLRWRSVQEVAELSAADKIYPPHADHVKAFLTQETGGYAEVTGIQ